MPSELLTRLRAIHQRPALAALLVLAAALGLGACGSGAATSPSTTTTGPVATTPVTPTTLTKASVSQQVISAYGTMWADLVVAATTSDFQSPLLAQHATGGALTLLVQGLARDQLHGIVTKGVTTHHPTVTSLSPARDPTRAVVSDCFDDSRWIEYTTDGKRAKNNPGGKRATTADLVKKDAVWKVSQLTIEGTGSC
jgi:hypothetical protein